MCMQAALAAQVSCDYNSLQRAASGRHGVLCTGAPGFLPRLPPSSSLAQPSVKTVAAVQAVLKGHRASHLAGAVRLLNRLFGNSRVHEHQGHWIQNSVNG